MNPMLILGFVGLVTGSVSFLVREFSFLPGAIFGVGVAGYFVFARKVSFGKFFTFVIVSTAAYHIAIRIMGLVNKIPVDEIRAAIQGTSWSFFLAGIGGALVMLLGFHALLSPLRRYWLPALTVLGGVLAIVAVTLFPIKQGASNDRFFFAMYVIWQTGMAVGLSMSLRDAGRTV